MAQMLVRDLSPEVVERLKERAVERQVSTEGSQGYPGGAANTYTMAEAREVTGRWQERFAGRKFSESAELIREDRDR